MIDLTKLTNDELHNLYGQIIAELAKRQSGLAFTIPTEPTTSSAFVPPTVPLMQIVWEEGNL